MHQTISRATAVLAPGQLRSLGAPAAPLSPPRAHVQSQHAASGPVLRRRLAEVLDMGGGAAQTGATSGRVLTWNAGPTRVWRRFVCPQHNPGKIE